MQPMPVRTGPPSRMTRGRRTGIVILLIFGALFYLQFGLQSLTMHMLQAVSVLIGAAGLGWAAAAAIRRRPAAGIALWGTMPALLVHAGMTIQDSGELPFLIGSIPAPLIAGGALLIRARR
ncbi:MAG TPA: hypothetical protein VM841_15000 [Actinomycetota bacterium]|nr:hypothetical protein [Actinomycetota bacterium]